MPFPSWRYLRKSPLREDVFVADQDAATMIPAPSAAKDIAYGIMPVMLEDNWFARCLPGRRVALTTFEIDGHNVEFWPTEKILAYMILKFSLNVRFLANGGKYSDLYTYNLEDSIYNFATTKAHAVYGLRSLAVGSRARSALANAGITDSELTAFSSDLLSLAPTLVQKFESVVQKNIWVSLAVSFVLGMLGNWLTNRL